MEVTLQNAPS